MSNNMIPGAPTLPVEECNCEHHCILHPVSKAYPMCIYSENPELAVNSKGQTTHTVPKLTKPDNEVVMQDEGFFIEKAEEGNPWDNHDSYITHFCPAMYWKVYLDEGFMLKEGICIACMGVVPPGLIALWKMHNWSYLQSGTQNMENEAVANLGL